jgi:hypothetical protein
MIFDDVMWPAYPRARANTAWAIHQFLKYHAREYKILHAQYQIILQKKTRFVDQIAEWCSQPSVPAVTPEPVTDTDIPQETHQRVLG